MLRPADRCAIWTSSCRAPTRRSAATSCHAPAAMRAHSCWSFRAAAPGTPASEMRSAISGGARMPRGERGARRCLSARPMPTRRRRHADAQANLHRLGPLPPAGVGGADARSAVSSLPTAARPCCRPLPAANACVAVSDRQGSGRTHRRCVAAGVAVTATLDARQHGQRPPSRCCRASRSVRRLRRAPLAWDSPTASNSRYRRSAIWSSRSA